MTSDVNYLKNFVAELDQIMTRPFKKPDLSKKSGIKNENMSSASGGGGHDPQGNTRSKKKRRGIKT